MFIVAKRLDGSKVSLGTKVGLGTGHIVLHGDPAPQKGTQPPIFGACLLSPSGPPVSATAEHLWNCLLKRDEFRRFSNTIRVSGV